MAKVYKKITVCGSDFTELYLQLQADAEFIHAKDDEDTLPYLIEISITEDRRQKRWDKPKPTLQLGRVSAPAKPGFYMAAYSMTLRVFESEVDKCIYIGADVEQDYIRRGKINIDFNPLVREKKK